MIWRLLSPLTRRASTSASRSVRSNRARAAVEPTGERGWPVSLARRASSPAKVSSGADGSWSARLSQAARARVACSRRPARTAAPASRKRAYASR